MTTLPAEQTATRTALYRFFDAGGQLLYVGITHRLRTRWREHARDYATTWWPLVASNTVVWYSTRAEAARVETRAIKEERPQFNVLHTPRHRVPRGARVSPRQPSSRRGAELLALAATHFAGKPFTQSDLVPASGLSKSAVQKSVRALVGRGELVVVGARTTHFASTLPKRSTLYVIKGGESALGGRVVETVGSRSAWVDGMARRRNPRYPNGRALDLLGAAATSFAGQTFTVAQLAEASGAKNAACIGSFVRELRQKGLLEVAGRAPRSPGSRGYPPAVYRVIHTDLAHT